MKKGRNPSIRAVWRGAGIWGSLRYISLALAAGVFLLMMGFELLEHFFLEGRLNHLSRFVLDVLFLGLFLFAATGVFLRWAKGAFGDLDRKLAEANEVQERLRRSERLSALGEMAAVMGHELRQPLTVIKNSVYYLKTKLAPFAPEEEKVSKYLDMLDRQVEICDRIISELLEFAKPRKVVLSVVDINLLIEEALSTAQLSKDVEVLKEMGALPQAVADAQQVRAVFLNIIVNAVEAMSGKGRLIVESQGEGNGVRVNFTNTGPPITEEDLPRIFEPFFTTKPKSTGLGLAICKSTVERHGGHIEVENKEDGGVAFSVFLPLSPREG